MESKKIKFIIGQETKESLGSLVRNRVLKNFYLAGGTGAALLLEHRRSYDLDFFSYKEFNSVRLIQKLIKGNNFKLEKKDSQTVIGLYKNTRVSFFYYPYKLLKPTKNILGVRVAHLIDIACMKIDAISGRGSRKDFIDLYFIIKRGYRLKNLLKYFSRKYSSINYNLLHIKKSLIYFKDAEKDPASMMLKKVRWLSVKKLFHVLIKNLG